MLGKLHGWRQRGSAGTGCIRRAWSLTGSIELSGWLTASCYPGAQRPARCFCAGARRSPQAALRLNLAGLPAEWKAVAGGCRLHEAEVFRLSDQPVSGPSIDRRAAVGRPCKDCFSDAFRPRCLPPPARPSAFRQSAYRLTTLTRTADAALVAAPLLFAPPLPWRQLPRRKLELTAARLRLALQDSELIFHARPDSFHLPRLCCPGRHRQRIRPGCGYALPFLPELAVMHRGSSWAQDRTGSPA